MQTDARAADHGVALFRHGVLADLLRTPAGSLERAQSTLHRRLANSGPTNRSPEVLEDFQSHSQQIPGACPSGR